MPMSDPLPNSCSISHFVLTYILSYSQYFVENEPLLVTCTNCAEEMKIHLVSDIIV